MRKGQGERREGKVREREEEIMEGQGERGTEGERKEGGGGGGVDTREATRERGE